MNASFEEAIEQTKSSIRRDLENSIAVLDRMTKTIADSRGVIEEFANVHNYELERFLNSGFCPRELEEIATHAYHLSKFSIGGLTQTLPAIEYKIPELKATMIDAQEEANNSETIGELIEKPDDGAINEWVDNIYNEKFTRFSVEIIETEFAKMYNNVCRFLGSDPNATIRRILEQIQEESDTFVLIQTILTKFVRDLEEFAELKPFGRPWGLFGNSVDERFDEIEEIMKKIKASLEEARESVKA